MVGQPEDSHADSRVKNVGARTDEPEGYHAAGCNDKPAHAPVRNCRVGEAGRCKDIVVILSRRNGVLPVFRWMAEYLKHERNWDLIPPELVEGKLSDLKSRGVLRQELVIGSNGETGAERIS